jgi:hypothetical protein
MEWVHSQRRLSAEQALKIFVSFVSFVSFVVKKVSNQARFLPPAK